MHLAIDSKSRYTQLASYQRLVNEVCAKLQLPLPETSNSCAAEGALLLAAVDELLDRLYQLEADPNPDNYGDEQMDDEPDAHSVEQSDCVVDERADSPKHSEMEELQHNQTVQQLLGALLDYDEEVEELRVDLSKLQCEMDDYEVHFAVVKAQVRWPFAGLHKMQ